MKPRVNSVRVNCVYDRFWVLKLPLYPNNFPSVAPNLTHWVWHLYRAYVVLRTLKCSRWRRVYNGDVVVAVSLVLNLKPFVISVSNKISIEKSKKVTLTRKNVNVSIIGVFSQRWKCKLRYLTFTVLVCLKTLFLIFWILWERI